MYNIDTLRTELDRLESTIGDLEEKRDDLQTRLTSAEAAAAGARNLAEAVRLYFSWEDSAPPNIEGDTFEALRRNFRQDVEQALRVVEV